MSGPREKCTDLAFSPIKQKHAGAHALQLYPAAGAIFRLTPHPTPGPTGESARCRLQQVGGGHKLLCTVEQEGVVGKGLEQRARSSVYDSTSAASAHSSVLASGAAPAVGSEVRREPSLVAFAEGRSRGYCDGWTQSMDVVGAPACVLHSTAGG